MITEADTGLMRLGLLPAPEARKRQGVVLP